VPLPPVQPRAARANTADESRPETGKNGKRERRYRQRWAGERFRKNDDRNGFCGVVPLKFVIRVLGNDCIVNVANGRTRTMVAQQL
jgi:hypothetical protein